MPAEKSRQPGRVIEGLAHTLRLLGYYLVRIATYKNYSLFDSKLLPYVKRRQILPPAELEPGSEETKEALISALQLHRDAEVLVNQYANRYYDGKHPKHHLWVGHNRFLIDECKPGDNVIDIGCGGSAYQNAIAQKVKRIVAVDIDPKRIEIAKRNQPDSLVDYRVMDVTREIPEEKFDVAICSHVLEHLDDPVSFLRSLRNVANKIVIKVPLQDTHWIKMTRRDVGLPWLDDADHRREYTEDMLTDELCASGWRLEKLIRGFDLRAVALSRSDG